MLSQQDKDPSKWQGEFSQKNYTIILCTFCEQGALAIKKLTKKIKDQPDDKAHVTKVL